MSELPQKRFLRRGEVMAYLGVPAHVMSQMVACGTLKPVYLTGENKRAFFKRDEVLKIGGSEQSNKGNKGL